MNRQTVKHHPAPAPKPRRYLRLRTLQRVGLLGPLLRLQRKIDGR